MSNEIKILQANFVDILKLAMKLRQFWIKFSSFFFLFITSSYYISQIIHKYCSV